MVHSEMAAFGHEQVTHFHDEETGLRAIIALHDTTLGPGLGGTRMLPYETHADALEDVLRLSRGMTYKAAAADLDLGGGKAVIVGNPNEKTEDMMRAYGRAVERLGGHYITSVDMNTTTNDMDAINEKTGHVTGLNDGLGDPSPVTAEGVFSSIEACAEAMYGRTDLSGRTVAIQGLGKVGRRLAEQLLKAGATVKVTDVNEAAVDAVGEEYDVETIAPGDIYSEPCDIFTPCAIGGVINDDTIPQLECDIVAGAANNILEHRRHAQALHDHDILYAPDYVINAGGLITVATEYFGGTKEDALSEAAAIGPRLAEFIERSEDRDVPVLEIADAYAEERIGRGK